MRDLLASLLILMAILSAPALAADGNSVLDIRVLDPAAGEATAEAVNSGSLDGQFVPFHYRDVRRHTNSFWLRVQAPAGFMPWFDAPGRRSAGSPLIFGHWAALQGRANRADVFALDTGCVWGGELTLLNLETRQFHRCSCAG